VPNSSTPIAFNPMQLDITVLGLGYIGLAIASIFATKGEEVPRGRRRPARRGDHQPGRHPHCEEPDLDALVRAAVQSGNMRAASKSEPAPTHMVAVPTPFDVRHDGSRAPDLAAVESATPSPASVIRAGDLVISSSKWNSLAAMDALRGG
jgi:UDP-N-acetyl-D-mannosaminuronic acid dehydrogenase